MPIPTTIPGWLNVAEPVARALRERKPVVALESTLICHGLPWPTNLETAIQIENVARLAGATPATIAVWKGEPTIGLTHAQIEELAKADGVMKASRRDLAVAVGLKKHAATTVSGTMVLAHSAGIPVFATGGIGGAHRDPLFDISADLGELARTPVLVVCSGAKSILHLPRTLELLESLSVPVVGYQTDEFPEFIVRAGSRKGVRLRTSASVGSVQEAAAIFRSHVEMGGGGMVLAQPCPQSAALDPDQFDRAIAQAELDTTVEGITGQQLTPFLLSRLVEHTQGQSLTANRALILNNVKLAAQVAIAIVART